RTDAGLFSWLAPAEAACNHQMNDQEQFVVEHQDDAFPDATDRSHDRPGHGGDRGFHRSQDERAAQQDTVEALPSDPFSERLDVDRNVWEFWHGGGGTTSVLPALARVLESKGSARRALLDAKMQVGGAE